MDDTQYLSPAEKARDQATALMARHDVPPTPVNFAIWYGHVSGDHPALSKDLQDLMDRQQPFTVELSKSLHDTHFGFGNESAAIAGAGRKLESELHNLSGELNQAEDQAKAYCDRIADLVKGLRTSDSGADVANIVNNLVGETRDILEINRRLEKQLEDSATEIGELRDNLSSERQAAMHDPLTGILNRKYFDVTLTEDARQAVANGQDLCLIMSDIDHFKSFNDRFGHQVGDQVLKVTAHVLKSNIKGRDSAARYGGEEFCVILPQTSLADAVTLADNIRDTLAKKELKNRANGRSFGTITMSLGVAQYVPGEPLTDLIERADKALYEAKHGGRNRTVAAGGMAATRGLEPSSA
jgi:diguanylate cyclase